MACRSVGSISSSSSADAEATVEWKYDVFLSFRGADTRMSITYELYDGLQNKRGIKTFMDNHDLEVGDPISPTLLKAIEQSRFAIIVLSPNYASSTWCLEELAKICECMKDDHTRVLPLFYNVEPSDVRYRKRSFGEAFNKHGGSSRHATEKLQLWRDALETVAGISGWDTKDFKTDRQLIDSIVEFVYSKVQSFETEWTLSATGDFQAFEETKKAINGVLKALQDKEVTAIGVYGMGGVGKTTMVKHISAEACKKRMFDNVIVVVVSQSPQVSKIQQTFAEQLGFNLQENLTESGRASRLYNEILRKQNIIIILDDIWKFIDLSTLGIPAYYELKKCNSKVLLTTRILHVCNSMRTQANIPLSILSKDDSWTLFMTNARRTFESTKFNSIARKVAGECNGLPIALVAVARALGDKDLMEWEKAAQRLEKSQSATLDDEEDAYKCIKFSYDYLRDEDSKACFLLCCLFPEDKNINIKHIFRYAIGIGLFRDCETMFEARGKAESVFKYLKDCCLLLEGDIVGSVRMHDVIRDTAMNIAKSLDGHGFFVKAGLDLEQWPRLLSEGYTAVSLMENYLSKLPLRLACPKLQILLLNQNFFLNIPETYLQCLSELRVLDLSFNDISVLPQSFGLLTNLRSLSLDRVDITDITIVGKLTELEILSMRHIKLEELPREIGDLSNLRVLDTTGGEIARIPFKLISRLHSLEELYLEYRFRESESQVEGEGNEDNACFDEIVNLSKLRVLKAWISNEECIPNSVELSPNWVQFMICIGKEYQSVNMVNHHSHIFLNLENISNLPDWFVSLVMNKADGVVLEGCPRLSDVFLECESGRLHVPKHLTVSGVNTDYENSATWIPVKPLFENMELLELFQVDCQEALSVVELAAGSLYNLRYLDVKYCYNWGNNVLLPPKLLQRLENLEELICHSMKEIEYLIQNKEILEPQQLKLRDIYCCELATLKSLCDGPAPPALFQNLEQLKIENCWKLEGSLFTSDVDQCLFQLKVLDLQYCPYLERLNEAIDTRIILPKLEILRLAALPMLYHASSTMTLECPSLQVLYVERCPKITVSAPRFCSSFLQLEPSLSP